MASLSDVLDQAPATDPASHVRAWSAISDLMSGQYKQSSPQVDLLCERVLFEFAKPALELAEYHLIDLATGFSHGGFKSLAAARQYAREEAIPAWQIFRGNVRIEQHDPREADPIC